MRGVESMQISFEKLDILINLEEDAGAPSIDGPEEMQAIVKNALANAFGAAGHLFFLDFCTDYDLWAAVLSTLSEYIPSVDQIPTIPDIPEGAVS